MDIAATTSDTSSRLVGNTARLRLFVVAWACAHLVHLIRHPSQMTEGLAGALSLIGFLAAVVVLLRPSDSRWFALMTLMGTLHTAFLLPFVVNHAVILSLINLTVLTGWIRSRAWRAPTSVEWFTRVEPFLRLSLILAYGSAALAKLNPDFFSLPGSCAVALYNLGAVGMPWAGFQPGIWIAYVVAGIELAIPALLFMARTRAYGILLALLFHLALVIGPYSPGRGFTWLLYALLVPFLATQTAQDYANELDRIRSKVQAVHRWAMPAVIVMPLAVAAFITWALGQTHMMQLRWTLPLALAIVLVVHIAPRVWRDRNLRLAPPAFAIRGLSQWTLAVLLLMNAASPYIGGKTITAFTMYSNISTEGGVSNHLFIPRLPITTSQDDLVEIVESEVPYLQWVTTQNLLITWHELRREMTANPDSPLVYVRDGKTVSLQSGREDPELISTHPVWHRLIAHREVADDGRCFW
jgi:hypothetical protein